MRFVLLTAGETQDLSVEVVDVELSQDLTDAGFIVPGIGRIHAVGHLFQIPRACRRVLPGVLFQRQFVLPGELYYRILVTEDQLRDGSMSVETGLLFEVSNANILPIRDSPESGTSLPARMRNRVVLPVRSARSTLPSRRAIPKLNSWKSSCHHKPC